MMLVLLILFILVVAVSGRSSESRRLHKKGGTNNETTLYPTIAPSATPTNLPMLSRRPQIITSSPEHSSKPLIEICSRENAEKLDVCIEQIKNETSSPEPSIAPFTLPTIKISTDAQTDLVIITDDVTFNFIDDIEKVKIEIGPFEMSITIAAEAKSLRSYDRSAHYSQGGHDTRQYEHEAVKQHLHKAYTEFFLCPLRSLTLTFIDRDDTNASQTNTRSSIFYGFVEFEIVEGYHNPTKSEVDDVTDLAFSDNEKNLFLELFRSYCFAVGSKTLVCDVKVDKFDQEKEGYSADGIKHYKDAIAILPVVGFAAGTIAICFVFVAFFFKKRSNLEGSTRVLPKASPLNLIHLKKHEYGEFETDDEVNINFQIDKITDAYIDSASIRSRSSDDSVLQQNLELYEENKDCI